MATLTRSYVVQSLAQAADARVTVILFEDNSKADANGAPMGSSTVNFQMSAEEARGFFPADKITITLSTDE